MRSWKVSGFFAVLFIGFGILQVFGPNGSVGLALMYGLIGGMDLQETLDKLLKKRPRPMIATDNVCQSENCCQEEL